MYTSLAIGATLIAVILLVMLCLIFRAIVLNYSVQKADECASLIWSSLQLIAMAAGACAASVWLLQKAVA